MLDTVTRRLTILIVTVFVLLTTFFAVVVYWWICHQSEIENKQYLESFSRTLSASIESPEEEAHEHLSKRASEIIPDVLEQHEGVVTQHDIGLQWFDKNGILLASKGELQLKGHRPETKLFEEQASPHAMILTEAVNRDGQTVGYLRTGLSLERADLSRERLRNGLVIGIVSTLLLAAIATKLIVEEALKPAKKAFAKLMQFTADASHELKTPIAAIKMNSEVLHLYTKLDAQQTDLIESINNAAQQMHSTVNDLLSLAKSDTKFQPLSGKCNVQPVITDVISELVVFAERKGIEIVCNQLESTVEVSTIANELKCILSNIVKNAIQFSSENSKVIVTTTASQSEVEFSIQDFGSGIDAENLTKVFDRFWRADPARPSNSGGNGLGLAIAQSIVTRCKGKISVNSTPGEGSVFKVVLPRA